MRRVATVMLFPLMLAAVASCGPRPPRYPEATAVDGKVSLPLAAVADGGVHFYSYLSQGKTVDFFVRTDGEGKLHASFDACYGCFQYKLGYRVEGDAVVCNACRLSFALKEAVWDYIGPCAPIPLPHRDREGFFVIDAARLEKGARYF